MKGTIFSLMVLNSDLERNSFPVDWVQEKDFPSRSHLRLENRQVFVPFCLARSLSVYVKRNGSWQLKHKIEDNCKRLILLDIYEIIEGVRIICEGTWGADECSLYSVDCLG